MENIHKYFVILEQLEKNATIGNERARIQSNLDIIHKFIKDDISTLSEKPSLKEIGYVAENKDASEDLTWTYATLLYHILLSIKQNINLNSSDKDELISLQQQENFCTYVVEASTYGVCPNLISQIQSHKIFKLDELSGIFNLPRLKTSIKFLEQMYTINFLIAGSKIDPVKLQSMAATFCISASEDETYTKQFLCYLWKHSCKVTYFKNLLILKSVQKIPQNIQKKLHEDLLLKLQTEIGFKVLLEAIVPTANIEAPNWKCFEIVANIVSHKGHSEAFYENLLNQIFEFLQNAAGISQQHGYIPAGVLSLRKLYFLKTSTKEKILNIIDSNFKKLYNPEDLITGAILFEGSQYSNLIKFFSFLFCGSSQQCLPSEILVQYLPILIHCYDQASDTNKTAELLKSLCVQCLANRTKPELKKILTTLIVQENGENLFKELHPRISFNINENLNCVNVQIGSPEQSCRNDNFAAICHLLKTSKNNILIYNSFVSVLYSFDEANFEWSAEEDSIGLLLQNEEELQMIMEKKFKTKFAVISFLTDLIEFKPLHTQFKENPVEILDFIKSSLSKYLNGAKMQEEKLSIILAIFQEVAENSENIEIFKQFVPIVKKLSTLEPTLALKHQLKNIIKLLEGEVSPSKTFNVFEKSNYEIARGLIEENQPYLRVYGITQMIKLIKQKDCETISKKHAVLAMALHALNDEESYTFLNCVKLFVTLISALEAEVLDVLSDEYLSDNNKIDYRLKIGEAMLKVTEDLGPLSYKYKNVLINCFLHGSRHPTDEFRLSSISNLATICKLLTYQVHNFFQELLQMIESILESDKYLPAKRAAVLVLTQLLCGMENLLDFQDFLLPIYRALKHIAANDQDAVMRVHANNGLQILKEKCKKLFLAEQSIQKEIKIFGIKDSPKKKSSNFILELN